MSGKKIINSMKEAVAISKGELPSMSYKVHIPESVDVKAIREKLGQLNKKISQNPILIESGKNIREVNRLI